MYGFARIPQPTIGGVDIASVFIERDKFVEQNVFFSKFDSLHRLFVFLREIFKSICCRE